VIKDSNFLFAFDHTNATCNKSWRVSEKQSIFGKMQNNLAFVWSKCTGGRGNFNWPRDGHGSNRCPSVFVWIVHLSAVQDLRVELSADDEDSAIEDGDSRKYSTDSHRRHLVKEARITKLAGKIWKHNHACNRRLVQIHIQSVESRMPSRYFFIFPFYMICIRAAGDRISIVILLILNEKTITIFDG